MPFLLFKENHFFHTFILKIEKNQNEKSIYLHATSMCCYFIF